MWCVKEMADPDEVEIRTAEINPSVDGSREEFLGFLDGEFLFSTIVGLKPLEENEEEQRGGIKITTGNTNTNRAGSLLRAPPGKSPSLVDSQITSPGRVVNTGNASLDATIIDGLERLRSFRKEREKAHGTQDTTPHIQTRGRQRGKLPLRARKTAEEKDQEYDPFAHTPVRELRTKHDH